MSENLLIDEVAEYLFVLAEGAPEMQGGYNLDDAKTDAESLLELIRKAAMKMMGVSEDARAWEPLCGSNVVGVTITKDGELHPGSSDPERWMMIMFDAEESGHMARSVSLNKRISQYLRSTLAMIEDELPE